MSACNKISSKNKKSKTKNYLYSERGIQLRHGVSSLNPLLPQGHPNLTPCVSSSVS